MVQQTIDTTLAEAISNQSSTSTEQSISCIFKTQKQVDDAIGQLLDLDVPREKISILGRNFESETRISGFITKRTVITEGLKSGAIFGSLFGSLLSAFTGVGVLFIPFVGPLVAAGPLSALLLGATTGALAGSAGAGLASALATLGMPEDKAAVYETRLKAGEFLLVVNAAENQLEAIQMRLNGSGAEEIHVVDRALQGPCHGRCDDVNDLSPEVRSHLSPVAQEVFMEQYNHALDKGSNAHVAEEAAWDQVRAQFDLDDNGLWSREKAIA